MALAFTEVRGGLGETSCVHAQAGAGMVLPVPKDGAPGLSYWLVRQECKRNR